MFTEINAALEYLKVTSHLYNVNEIAKVVLEDPRFPLWSAAARPELHHYGEGGLVRHTAEVVELCMVNQRMMMVATEDDERAMYLAALYHDYGKIWDYTPVKGGEYSGEWTYTQHKTEIHHISRSGLMWMQNCKGYPRAEEIWHAILAHHGRRDWGSPVPPNTRMAWLLHLCDCISARMDDCDNPKIRSAM